MPPTTTSEEAIMYRSAALLYAAVITGFIAMYLPQPILPQLAQAFDVSPSAASLSIGMLVMSIAVASLFVGPLSDRIGRKPVLVSCALFLAVPSLGCAFAQDLPSLLFWRAMQGLCIPGLIAVSVAYIAEEFPQQAGTLLGGYIAATVSGGLLSRILSGSIADAFGWRWAFVLSALLSVAVGLLLLRMLPASRRFVSSQRLIQAFSGMARHLRNRQLVGGFIVGFTLFFAFLGLFTYLPFYLAAPPFSFSATAVGLMYLTYSSGIVSSPLAGWLTQRYSRQNIMAVGILITMLAQLATLQGGTISLIAALLLLCFGNFIVQGTTTAYVASKAERDRASASSLYLFFYYIGGSIGAVLPGMVWERMAWPGVLMLTLSALFLALLSVLLFCHEDEDTQPSAQQRASL